MYLQLGGKLYVKGFRNIEALKGNFRMETMYNTTCMAAKMSLSSKVRSLLQST